MTLRKKAFGLILSHHGDQTRLLTLTFPGADGLRFPGGNLDAGESPLDGLFREIEKETGLVRGEVELVRKLGTHQYYKDFIRAQVERHDYLLKLKRSCPTNWVHIVTGDGGDAGATFQIRLIDPSDHSQISTELATFVTPKHIPEFFVLDSD